MSERLDIDMDAVKNIGVFLKQDRNGDHLSDEDIKKAREAVDHIIDRLNRYKEKA